MTIKCSIIRASTLVAMWIWGITAVGCASASISPDVARVRHMARAPALVQVRDVASREATAPDVETLLNSPLDANRAVSIALINNRALRAKLRELGIARGRLMQAGLVANPVVEFEALPERNTAFELRVEYEITSLVLAPLRVSVAEAELDAERHAAAAAVVQLGLEVRTAVYELQAAEQRLAVAREALTAFAASRATADALLAAGNIAQLAAATQITAHERAQVLVAQLEFAVIEAKERLQQLLGLSGKEGPWQVVARLSHVPESPSHRESAEELAIRASHDLSVLKSRQQAVMRRATLSRTEGWLPDITVDLHSLHGTPTEGSSATREVPWRFGGGVSLGVPVFDRKQGNTRAFEAEFDGMQERYSGLVLEIRSAVRAAHSRVLAAHQRAHKYDAVILPSQHRVMEQTLLQYNAMQVGVFELLRTRREQLDVELAYVDTLLDYWRADATFYAILEGSPVNSIASSSGSATSKSTNNSGEHGT